jgi:hypothetical protein
MATVDTLRCQRPIEVLLDELVEELQPVARDRRRFMSSLSTTSQEGFDAVPAAARRGRPAGHG